MGYFAQLDVLRRQAIDAGVDDARITELLDEEMFEDACTSDAPGRHPSPDETADLSDHDRFSTGNITFIRNAAQVIATLCPHCGQSIVPAGLISLPIKRRILDAVRRRPGIAAEELRGIVWADDPNGGSEDRKVLHVHISTS